jgi:phytoene desaturase
VANQKVDAVVIGSGVGGMTCAARLIAKGMKVIVLERLPDLGGRFSTRIVKGYKIPTGAMIVPHGGKSVFQEAYDLVNAPLEVIMTKNETTYRLPHGDYELPPKGGGLAGMMTFALQDEARAKQLAANFFRALTWMEPSYAISFKEWLAQYTHDDNVHRMFQGFCAAFIGVNSYEVPAGEFFRFLKNLGRNINYGIAPEGNLAVIESLANAIEQKGGRVEREADVKSILVERNGVKGVVAEIDGKEARIEADFVVSNSGPSQTIRLAGEANFEKSYLTMINEHNFTVPVVYLAIGSKEPLYNHTGVLNFGNTRRLIFLETPSLTCPQLAPEGRHLTITYSVPKYSTGPLQLPDTINMAMKDLEENFPTFANEAEVIHIGSHHGDWPTMHRWPGYPAPTKTSIERLYNTGDGCMPSGTVGIEACARSAKEVADDILNRTANR